MKKIFFWAITFFLLVLFIEFAAYLLISKKEPVVPMDVYQYHPILGKQTKPNSQASSLRTGEKIVYKFDQYGARTSPWTEQGESQCTVVALGDSETMGFGLNSNEIWTSKLNQRNKKLKVYNFAVSGYGIDQNVLRFEHDAKKTNPQLVIVNLPHFGAKRHMAAFRFGFTKPYYDWNQNTDQLNLMLAHMHKPLKLSLRELLPEFSQSSFVVKLTNMALENVEKALYSKQIYSDKQINDSQYITQKAIRILKQFEEKLVQSNLKLLVTTSMSGFCEKSLLKHCIHLEKKPSHRFFTKTGEDLNHPNHLFHLEMSELIENYLVKKKLLNQVCFE